MGNSQGNLLPLEGFWLFPTDVAGVGAFKDIDIYMATGKKEREANFFAADFLIADEEVIELMKTCDANFFNVAKALSIPAPFFAFKLYSMVERGYAMHVPVDLDSAFLAH